MADELMTLVTNKADKDMLNTPDNVDVVVETFVDGDTWYRKYKSGWVEQGGAVLLNAGNPYNVVFPVPYTSKVINITLTAAWGVVGASKDAQFANETLTGFQMFKQDNASSVKWAASGI